MPHIQDLPQEAILRIASYACLAPLQYEEQDDQYQRLGVLTEMMHATVTEQQTLQLEMLLYGTSLGLLRQYLLDESPDVAMGTERMYVLTANMRPHDNRSMFDGLVAMYRYIRGPDGTTLQLSTLQVIQEHCIRAQQTTALRLAHARDALRDIHGIRLAAQVNFLASQEQHATALLSANSSLRQSWHEHWAQFLRPYIIGQQATLEF